MEKSNSDLQHLAKKVNTQGPKPVSTLPKADPMEIAAPVAAPAAAGSLPKTGYHVLEIKPTNAAIPHRATDGNIDYWLVARSADKGLAKVLPIAISADGVVVHNLEDGKNYTLTAQGEWRNSEW